MQQAQVKPEIQSDVGADALIPTFNFQVSIRVHKKAVSGARI